MIEVSRETITDIIKATLLLTLSISGNFLAETLGCQSQKWLQNMYVKHILILFMIYFTINFTQKEDQIVNPIDNLLKALAVWVLYHLFTHMDILPTFIVVILLMIVYVLTNYNDYLKKKMEKSQAEEKLDYLHQMHQLHFIREGAFMAIIISILSGFFIYSFEKHQEYKKRFSFIKYIFGVKKCRHI